MVGRHELDPNTFVSGPLARTAAYSQHTAAQLEQYRVQLEESQSRLAEFEAREAARIRLEQAGRKLFGRAELVGERAQIEGADVSAPRRLQPRARVCDCHPPCGAARFLPAKPARGPLAATDRCGRRTDGWHVARARQCPGVRPADQRPSHRQAGSCAHVLSPAHIPCRRRT